MDDAITRLVGIIKDKKFLRDCSDIEISSIETQLELAKIWINKEKQKRGLE